MSADKTSWVSKAPLDRRHAVPRRLDRRRHATVCRSGYQAKFHTQALTLDQQTYPSFVPADGETVGVGMPVIVKFDVAGARTGPPSRSTCQVTSHAGPARRLALDQRQRGPLAPEELLEARHRR